MLEAGLVRSKNTTEILTKNICLYAIACTTYLVVGYNIMYVDNGSGGFFPSIGTLIGTQAEGADHSLESDFFFQVVFVATAMSVVSGAVAERMKLWSFLIFSAILTAFIYPMEGYGHGVVASYQKQDSVTLRDLVSFIWLVHLRRLQAFYY